MRVPDHMVVDRNGFVFVVDLNNDRVLLLSPVLNFVRDVSRDKLRWGPERVHLDSDGRHLYVADNDFEGGEGINQIIIIK